MKKILVGAGLLALTATAALAKPPIFAAQCAGGTNAGGYNIDTDTEGHVWINGTKTTPTKVNANYWTAKAHGIEVEISKDANDIIVTFTGKHGANGICPVISQ
jgi:ABC-type glycerol-3-phosphate transport system substrate-binding protein